MKKNKPRIFSNTINLKKEKSILKKVYLHCVTIEKMMGARLGKFNQKKCYTIM